MAGRAKAALFRFGHPTLAFGEGRHDCRHKHPSQTTPAPTRASMCGAILGNTIRALVDVERVFCKAMNGSLELPWAFQLPLHVSARSCSYSLSFDRGMCCRVVPPPVGWRGNCDAMASLAKNAQVSAWKAGNSCATMYDHAKTRRTERVRQFGEQRRQRLKESLELRSMTLSWKLWAAASADACCHGF
ncbi:hypothetical protein M011DRAFT_265838 [Sporormia fimetaria CBS 119925]|uniref:Uncharacterized protein n=1 Tax=Sporormia fimetaria CBS 119925 TaxID=1340428 RepID=A0A6A6UWN9_9PLEO|nr:hypothetical protein M011DRAFT_265838 [Sporormia fimetaria CBS 119925]